MPGQSGGSHGHPTSMVAVVMLDIPINPLIAEMRHQWSLW